MDGVVSPYHLTTREPAAMAGLLLSRSVVTLLPTPAGGASRNAVHGAAGALPAYLRFMESWRWSMPLWDAGVVCSQHEGCDPADDAGRVRRWIATDDRLSGLRMLMQGEEGMSPAMSLNRLAADILKAGPDPAYSLPVAAGLDAFAAGHGLVVFRARAVSLAQRAEARLGRRVLALAVPILTQAGGDRLLETRDALGPQLDGLRAVLERSAHDDADERHMADDLSDAAGDYTRAFAEYRDELTRPDDDDVRVMVSTVALEGVRLPADAALRSSTAAMRGLAMTPSGAESTTAPVLWDPREGRTFLSLVVRPMGRRASGYLG